MKMKKTILIANLLIAAILMSGCATIVTGKYQNISVTSEPTGALVRADNGMSITTPGSFKLMRNQRYTLIAEYPGAEPQQKKLKRGLQGWFWGNILLVSCICFL
jgi:predicted small secreted protein